MTKQADPSGGRKRPGPVPCGLTPTEIKRRWEQSNKGRRAEVVREYRARSPAAQMLANAKARAKANEIPFSITIADVVIPDVCPVLGIPIRTKGGRENAPSLDKVIPSLGYTTGNVRVISMRANRLKSDATPEELRALAEYVETHQAGRTNNAVP